MKLNCCILENETIYTEHLIQLLYQWQNNRSCSLMIDTVCSAAELYQLIHQKYYAVIFIDIVLDHGEIIEQGNHHQLVNSGGYYSKLYNSYYESLG